MKLGSPVNASISSAMVGVFGGALDLLGMGVRLANANGDLGLTLGFSFGTLKMFYYQTLVRLSHAVNWKAPFEASWFLHD
jgi:hypothetical protein